MQVHIDLSILPKPAQDELYDFYIFLRQKYSQNPYKEKLTENLLEEHKAWNQVIEIGKNSTIQIDPSMDIRTLISTEVQIINDMFT